MAIEVGAVVRVPLGGRRVRGFVVDVAERPDDRLKPIAARSGDAPVFDRELFGSLQTAARHYIAPVSVMLERSAPPNNPALRPPRPPLAMSSPSASPLPDLSRAAATGKRVRPAVWVGPVPGAEWIARIASPVLAGGRSVMVVVATVVEVRALTGGLSGSIAVDGEMGAAALTRAWGDAQQGPCLVIGTPRLAGWRVADLGLAVVIEDGRRAMKDRQTPTVHARDLLRIRSRHEGFALAMAGPTPSVEAVGWGSVIVTAPGRAWPLVEIIDQGDHPPGSLLAEPTRRAIQTVVGEGGTVFVFAHRRAHAAALRCVACRTLRRCGGCGTRLVDQTCERCGAAAGPCSECGKSRFEAVGSGVGRVIEEVARVVGRERVQPSPADVPVEVGTEKDLLAVGIKDLVVMVDTDGMLFSSNYRAAEETLRVGARLAGRVRRGRRMIAQTSEPSHPVITALRSGNPVPFLRAEVGLREELGYPPAGDLMVVEARGPHPVDEFDRDLRTVVGNGLVMGPAPRGDGHRWLIQGSDLGPAKIALRPLVQRWRDGGVTVRIDVDPIDL